MGLEDTFGISSARHAPTIGRSRPVDADDWCPHMNRRLRAEFIAGAEEEWLKRTGRPMTAEELERMLRRYPGDI
jgi:hypothetical protein